MKRLICISLSLMMLLSILPVFAVSAAISGIEDPAGFTIREVFTNGEKQYKVFSNNSTGAYIQIEENSGDSDKVSLSGTPALMFNGSYKAGISVYEYMVSMLSMPCIDAEKSGLYLEVKGRKNQPLPQDLYVGLVCYGNILSGSSVTPAGGAIRINLKNYITLSPTQWSKVVIPFKYFMENGEFISFESGEGALSEFDYERTNGVYFGASNEKLTTAGNSTIFAMFDNIRFVEYINEPDRLTVTKNGKGADISWSESKGYDEVEGYKLYRRKGSGTAQLIATLQPDVRHYTDTVTSSGTYTYIVQAFNSSSGIVSNPVISSAVSMTTSGSAPTTSEASPSISSLKLFNRRGELLSDGASSTYINGVEATVSFSGSGFFDGILKTEVLRNGTLIESFETSISDPAGITAVYNDDHQYTTILPGAYTIKSGIYKNGSLVSNSVEKSFTVSAPSASYTLTVENTARQTMDGWGCCPISAREMYYNWDALDKLIMQDLGINIARFFVFQDSFDVNSQPTAAFENNLDLIKYCSDNNIDKYILTWLGPEYQDSNKNPSVWVEKNIANYTENNGWIESTYRLKRSMEEKYIDAIINHLKLIRQRNLPLPYGICIQNEPRGAHIAFVRPSQYKRLVKMLDSKLTENGLSEVNIIAFEPVSYQKMYFLAGDRGVRAGTSYLFDFSEFDYDPAFRNAVDIVGLHTYDPPSDKTVSAQFAYNYDTILNRMGKKKWMTEFSLCAAAKDAVSSGLDYDMEALFREITGLLGDVIWAGNSAWLHHMGYYANDALKEDGFAYSLTADPTNAFTNGLVYGPKYASERVMKKGNVYNTLQAIFKNAPAGSVVKRVTSNWSSLNNSYGVLADLGAFENGNSSVVVLANQSTDDAYITINNLKGAAAEINTVTSGTFELHKTDEKAISSGSASGIFIPAKSVSIIITK